MKKLALTLIALLLLPSLASAARLRAVGFETGSTTELTSTAGTFSIQTSTVRTGTYALRANPSTTATGLVQITRFNLTTGKLAAINSAQIWTRAYFRYDTKPASGDEPILAFRNGTTVKNSVRINSSGTLAIYDTSGTLVATGATVLSANTWYRIETYSLNSASGAYELKIDGAVELSGSGMNYLANNVNNLLFGKVTNENGNTVDFFYDDIAIDDAEYPGAGQIKMAIPDGNGSAQTWSIGAGAGSHYENIDEFPHDSDTTYLLSTGTSTDAELETMQDSATVGITGTINYLQPVAIVKRDTATNGNVILRLLSNTSTTNTAGGASGTAYDFFGLISATDPNTGTAWTTAGFDGIEVGAVENNANKSRVTAIYVMVDYTPSADPPSITPVPPTLIAQSANMVFQGTMVFQ